MLGDRNTKLNKENENLHDPQILAKGENILFDKIYKEWCAGVPG